MPVVPFLYMTLLTSCKYVLTSTSQRLFLRTFGACKAKQLRQSVRFIIFNLYVIKHAL